MLRACDSIRVFVGGCNLKSDCPAVSLKTHIAVNNYISVQKDVFYLGATPHTMVCVN